MRDGHRETIDVLLFRHRLESAGFKAVKPGTWLRCMGEVLNMVVIQPAQEERRFSVSLGIHYTFLPKHETEAAIDLDQWQFADCVLKLRLSADPTISLPSWPMTMSAIREVAGLLETKGMPWFEQARMDGAAGSLFMSDPHLLPFRSLGIFAPLSRIQAYLLFARFHECRGQFASCLKLCQMALDLGAEMRTMNKALKHRLQSLMRDAQIQVVRKGEITLSGEIMTKPGKD